MVLTCRRGLIVDSALEMAQVLAEFLSLCGCQIDHVKVGVEALQLLRQKDYDFLVISNRTLGMDASRLCEKLCLLQPHLPTFFLGDMRPLGGEHRCLPEPYALEDLWEQIRVRMSQAT